MTAGGSGSSASSPYSTGGGGTVLEHRYGATLLAAVLAGDPVTELGDDVVPRSVRFQASAISPVDDLVVESDDGGVVRRVSIGVRRAPELTRSDDTSVPLLRSYLRVVANHWAEVESGRWRLALAVASANPAVRQLRNLAVVARASSDSADFRARVEQPGVTNGQVRDRLVHLDALVAAAAAGLDLGTEVTAEGLTWQLLSVLRVRELRLEGVDETDRTQAVRSLRSVVADGTPAAADAVFTRLAELTGSYAPAGARVTELSLRRDLVGSALHRSPTYAGAWALLDRLDQRLREWTRTDLRDAAISLELDRAPARTALVADMAAAGSAGALVVTGEPDVGKSALTLRAAEQLAADGATVTAISMRDLPTTPLKLEALLDAPLTDVLAGGTTESTRLLVLDGAEVALEGRAVLLQEVTLAALRAGMGVVAVTRTDGVRRVSELLGRAAQVAGTTPPREHVVRPLTETEADRLTSTLPALHRLGRDDRSHWLLGRPGLVDLLLQSGVVPAPGDILSEADVFAAVWGGLVRRHEEFRAGEPTPDQRDEAMTALARHALLASGVTARPDPAALPALRSDGLLKSDGLPAAWRAGDEFASDLVRDFAVTRLLITGGWEVLATADAPRWAIRAVRLACQVLLRRGPDVGATWQDLQSVFSDLATRFGQRWAELPLEALLTLGDAQAALTMVWPQLTSDGGAGARTLVRLALQRYTNNGFGDPTILSPIVALTFQDATAAVQGRHWRTRGNGAQVGELVLAWLRGLIEAETGPLPLRQRVRDTILGAAPARYDEFAVEAIASLGPDLDAAAEAFLRGLTDPGQDLWPAVESVGGILGMAAHRSQLLLDLAEAYYIDRAVRRGWDHLDDGIRDHRVVPIPSRPAWHHGPFWWLLNQRPAEALALINRMLDHAAEMRVRERRYPGGPRTDADTLAPGLDLELPALGPRRYVGDGDVWAWYRGSSVGPYPCMSALLAVERFADHLVDTLHIPIDHVVNLLLRDCHNLAMPGLVVGLLVRHLELAGDLLDPWLTEPEVWYLEISRATHEGVLHVQGRDDADTAGRDHRRWSLHDVAAQMTLRAALAGDEARLTGLADVGDELLSRARNTLADADAADEQLASIEGWAATFHPKNYRAEQTHSGVVLQYQHPEPVATVLGPSLANIATTNAALRLGNTYAAADDRTAPVDTLLEDITLARKLAAAPPPGGRLFSDDPVAAVAAAALVAHTGGRADVPADDLLWAADVLLRAAADPETDFMSFAGSLYSRGADRSAAAALPLLLLPGMDGLDLDRDRIAAALHQCATSVFDEVRTMFAAACAPVWTAPCDAGPGGRCRHRVLWEASQAGLRDARLGGWDPDGQRRMPDPVTPPYGPAITATATDSLLVNHLVPPLAAAASARAAACVSAEADGLLAVLLDAHRRGTDHWAQEGYSGYEDNQRQLMARVLVSLAIEGKPGPLTEHVRLFASNADALQTLLRDLALLFTYDDAVRPELGVVWRQAMTAALDAVDAGADLVGDHHWDDWAIGELLPTPHVGVADLDPDGTLRGARAGWIAPDSIADLVGRWLPLAQGRPKAADAVVLLAKCGPTAWQVTTGLSWAEQVIDGRYDAFAKRCWYLADWLSALREAGLGTPDDTARWRRLVDGLAAAGDQRAAELQRLEE
ncbi:MAG: hypothetical protein JWO98_1707 [Frankiales bacterium]|nr:hypothetical protein [Frankiales bacterium]